jgi:hypothetical protein
MSRKLRFLCLHGYEQNGELLRKKSGALRSFVKASAEFDFLDAPHAVLAREGADDAEGGAEGGEGESAGPRGWFLFDDFEAGGSLSLRGLAGSLAAVSAKFAADGPYDGLFGFSQGGALVAALALTTRFHLLAPGAAADPAAAGLSPAAAEVLAAAAAVRFQFAVVVSGFLPNDSALLELEALLLARGLPALPVQGVRSLHVLGRGDLLVPPEASRAVLSGDQSWEGPHFHHRRMRLALGRPLFDPATATVVEHSGGDLYPSNPIALAPA